MDTSFDLDLDSAVSDFVSEVKMEPSSSFASEVKMEPSTSSSRSSKPSQPRLHSEEDVFRSMKIKNTSTTPYSDATQVSRLSNQYSLVMQVATV